MRNLLYANLSRLKRDQVFWLCVFTALACSAGFMITWCLEAIEKGAAGELDLFYFRFAPAMGFFYAVFSCLFLAVEYSEGTIRNKLAVGHTRREVYLSSFLTIFAASLCVALAWLTGGLAGVPFLGFPTLGLTGMTLCVAVVIGFTAAFSAIYVFIGLLNDRRSVTVITISVWLILVLIAGVLADTLHEPEMIRTGMISMEDGTVSLIMEPNPYYLSGIRRKIYGFLVDFLPAGQADSLQNILLDHPLRMLLSSALITAAATFGGMRLFERKDLK
ncbi:MAG: ABC transporter permease subunit [Oscillibacter sp.]|nr:ABC transporter permease subunit [Oscillibacter sp.]